MRHLFRERSTPFLAAAGLFLSACGTGAAVSSTPAPPPTAAEAPAAPADRMPDRLNDKEFWALEQEISEPGGYFQIRDNFTSNEMEIGQLFTMLRDARVSGDVSRS